jgi:hypothetical protein
MFMPSKSIRHDVSMTCSISLYFFCLCKYVIFVQCSTFASSTFFDWNIDLIISYGIAFSSDVFTTSIFIAIFFYPI